MLLGFVLVGRALEERAKLRASADMTALQVGLSLPTEKSAHLLCLRCTGRLVSATQSRNCNAQRCSPLNQQWPGCRWAEGLPGVTSSGPAVRCQPVPGLLLQTCSCLGQVCCCELTLNCTACRRWCQQWPGCRWAPGTPGGRCRQTPCQQETRSWCCQETPSLWTASWHRGAAALTRARCPAKQCPSPSCQVCSHRAGQETESQQHA